MKIVSLNRSNWGQKRVFPFVGEVTIGEDGVVDVDQKVADHLVANSPEWAYEGRVEEKLPKPVVEESPKSDDGLKSENEALKKELEELKAKIAKSEEVSSDKGKEEAESEEVEEVKEVKKANIAGQDESKDESVDDKSDEADKIEKAKEVLAGKKKGELREICQKQNFPKEEWESLLVEDLRAYILSKV